ncbi:acetylcholinesterase-like [Vanessa tameamea]|uniref:Carboxylic ester hydrolase n=1 Tax=Vanessa tameamea TaxID=334116 RepID=A0A8B8IHF7_VANTA
MKYYWIVLWSLWAGRLVRQPTLPVRVRSGLVRGSMAADGTHISYLGIPYASYELRFQSSRPSPQWEGTLEAIEEHIRCSQRFSKSLILGQENCLTLNVYTPAQPANKLRPVMVYIHGGGFRDGSGSPFLYGPDYLIKHDVILVTFNYRLEVLGFLCLGIEDAPGNVGLKDQVQALLWVKRNIRAFGGDPDKVTLFGESAGSASVLYHIISPLSKGLFQRAIMQSGSAMSPWSLQFEPMKTAREFAKQMGYNFEDPHQLYELFQSKSAEELLSTRIPRLEGDVVLSENIFVPCVEKKIPNEEQFISDVPFNLISKEMYNKVPIIMGYNNAEGYMFVGKENDTTKSKFNFYSAMPRDLEFLLHDDKVKIAQQLQKIYNDTNNSDDMLLRLSEFEGDSGIIYPVTITTEMLAKSNKHPVYAYKLSYDGWMNIIKMLIKFWKYPGATHADDLFYMFKVKVTLVQSFFEMDTINKITTLWTNFAKYGDPSPAITQELPMKWLPVDKNDPHLLVIDRKFSSEPLWDDEKLLFWNKTYSKFRRKK